MLAPNLNPIGLRAFVKLVGQIKWVKSKDRDSDASASLDSLPTRPGRHWGSSQVWVGQFTGMKAFAMTHLV